MRSRRLLIGIALACSASGCAVLGGGPTNISVPAGERAALAKELEGNTFYLAASMYTSDFFGSIDRVFADPHPADMLAHFNQEGVRLQEPKLGAPILYAGLEVKVTALHFPDELADRSPKQPTAHPWIELRATDVVEGDKPVVLVLPRIIGSPSSFREYVTAMLGSKQWVTSWLEQRAPDVLDSIYAKTIAEGMSQGEVEAAMGHATNRSELSTVGAIEVVAEYGDLLVTFTGGTVSKIVSQRELAEAARVAAEEERLKKEAEAEAARLAAEETRKLEEKLRLEREAAEAAAKAERDTKEAELKAIADAKEAEEQRLLELEREKVRQKAAEEARRGREAEQARIEEAHQAQLARQNAAAKAEQAAIDEKLAAAKAEQAAADAEKAATLEKARAAVKDAQKALDKVVAKSGKPLAKAEGALAAVQKKREAAVAGADAAVGAARTELEAARGPEVEKGGTGRKLGMKVGAVDDVLARELLMKKTGGAVVAEVTADGPGARAGFRRDDVILSFDGKEVTDPRSLAQAASAAPTDQKVFAEVWRDGARTVLTFEPVGEVDEKRVAAAEAALEKAERAAADVVKRFEADVTRAEEAVAEARRGLDAKTAKQRLELANRERELAILEGRDPNAVTVATREPPVAAAPEPEPDETKTETAKSEPASPATKHPDNRRLIPVRPSGGQ